MTKPLGWISQVQGKGEPLPSRYVSAGRCIGGFVAGASSLMAPVLSWIKAFGVFIGADHCEIFSEGPNRAAYEGFASCCVCSSRSGF